MKNSTPYDNSPRQEDLQISSVAYRLWQEEGRPSGRYMEFWMRAEKMVMAAQQAPGAKALVAHEHSDG